MLNFVLNTRFLLPVKVLNQDKSIQSLLARETTEQWWILIESLLKRTVSRGVGLIVDLQNCLKIGYFQSPLRMWLVRHDEKMNKTWILIPNPSWRGVNVNTPPRYHIQYSGQLFVCCITYIFKDWPPVLCMLYLQLMITMTVV